MFVCIRIQHAILIQTGNHSRAETTYENTLLSLQTINARQHLSRVSCSTDGLKMSSEPHLCDILPAGFTSGRKHLHGDHALICTHYELLFYPAVSDDLMFQM